MTDASANVYLDAGAVASAGWIIADLEVLPSVLADDTLPVNGVIETVASEVFEP